MKMRKKKNVSPIDEPACVHLRLKNHFTKRKNLIHSCFWLNVWFLKDWATVCNLNYKCFCTACSRKQQCVFVSRGCYDHFATMTILQPYLCFKGLLWRPCNDYLAMFSFCNITHWCAKFSTGKLPTPEV